MFTVLRERTAARIRASVSPGFTCHDHGATVLQYAPRHQLLISGGRKGCIYIFDIRQRQLLHTFQAHDSAIKALALGPCEEYFTTGSAEGNIKVGPAHPQVVMSTCASQSKAESRREGSVGRVSVCACPTLGKAPVLQKPIESFTVLL